MFMQTLCHLDRGGTEWRDPAGNEKKVKSESRLVPAGMVESMLAERIVSLSWRLQRAERMQNEVFDDMIESEVTNPSARDSRERHCYNEGISSDDPRFASDHLALGRIATSDWAYYRILDRLLLYERRIENSLYKTINRLKQYQVIRQIKLDETPKPSLRLRSGQAPSVKEEAAGHSQPADKLSDLKKQSQFAAAHLGAKPLMKEDYNNNPASGCDENKAKRSQSQALESTKGVGKREKTLAAATSLTG